MIKIILKALFLIVSYVMILPPQAMADNYSYVQVVYLIKKGGMQINHEVRGSTVAEYKAKRKAYITKFKKQYGADAVSTNVVQPGWCGVLYREAKKAGGYKYMLSSDRTHSEANATAQKRRKVSDYEVLDILCSEKLNKQTFTKKVYTEAIEDLGDAMLTLGADLTRLGPVFQTYGRLEGFAELKENIDKAKTILEQTTQEDLSKADSSISKIYSQIMNNTVVATQSLYKAAKKKDNPLSKSELSQLYFKQALNAKKLNQEAWYVKYLTLAADLDHPKAKMLLAETNI